MEELLYMCTLPALQEFLTFLELVRLQLCTTTSRSDEDLEALILDKKAKMQHLLPYDHRSTELMQEASKSSVCFLLVGRCEHCHVKSYMTKCLRYPSLMFAHYECTKKAIVAQHFCDEVQQQSVLEALNNLSAYTDMRLANIRKRFDKVQIWLQEPRNNALEAWFRQELFRIVIHSIITCEKTLKCKLLSYYTSDQDLVETNWKDPIPFIRQLFREKEARSAARLKRELIMKHELGLYQMQRFSSRESNAYIRDNRFLHPSRDTVAKVALSLALMRLRVPQVWSFYAAVVSSVEFDLNRTAASQFPWVDYQKKRMRLWRGVARFAGKAALWSKSGRKRKRS